MPAGKPFASPFGSNNDDRRQWRKQGIIVGAVASKTQVLFKHEADAGCRNPGSGAASAVTERARTLTKNRAAAKSSSPVIVCSILEAVSRAGEGQHVTDVLDAREVHDHPLEAQAVPGVLHAAEIAHASDRLIGIALGAEDYVTDLKTTRSDGIELLFARCMILNAARSAGIAALDTVYSDVNNEEGFIAEATLIKKLGFDGKSVINPRQIEPLHHVFMPSEKDLNKARAIMDAIAEANARGSGVASLKGKMIDKPVVTRAKRLLDLYEAGSKIDEVEEI